MRAKKRDANEKEIVALLEQIGAQVIRIDDDRVAGIPDLIIGYRGVNYIAEVKTEEGKLSEEQKDFIYCWPGAKIMVIRSFDDFLKKVNKGD